MLLLMSWHPTSSSLAKCGAACDLDAMLQMCMQSRETLCDTDDGHQYKVFATLITLLQVFQQINRPNLRVSYLSDLTLRDDTPLGSNEHWVRYLQTGEACPADVAAPCSCCPWCAGNLTEVPFTSREQTQMCHRPPQSDGHLECHLPSQQF